MNKFFVEIGAANFETLLPLAKAGWGGIVVEPIPHLAEDLREMFSGTDVQVIEAAVSDYNGEIEMIVSHGSDWQIGISHVTAPNHAGYQLSRHEANRDIYGERITVKCLTLDKLLDDRVSVDLMKVDVEGHELNVFMNYSFRVKPNFIKIEHKHVDDKLLSRKLETNGYLVWTEKDDIYGVV